MSNLAAISNCTAQKGIFGADADFRQRFLRCISLDNGGVDISSAYPEKHTVRVLNRRPGFLTTTEGERIASRGLGNDTVEEYNCEYISTAQLNRATHPYNLGDLYMNITLLQLMKEALLELQPDGYFFTPAKCLAQIVNHVYAHVDMICEEIKDVKCFDPGTIGTYSPELYYAIVLCREIQSNREISDMLYTVRDMRIVSIAAAAVKSLFSNLGDKESNAQDLVWAVLVCPRLLQDLARIFSAVSIESLLSLSRQSETTFSEKGILHIEWLATFANKDNQGGQIEGTYKVPIMYTNERREFTPTQLVAAYVYVFLTFFWVSKAWVTDVTVYDVTIPQIVNMC